jgi:hypothetical protein
VSGVAGGARLIPLRVASRVVLLDVIEADMDNLAAAIRAAAIGDPNYVDARAHIISMSLGGAPSRAVRDALKVAQQQNVIVLAAAGNQVPTRAVVWPARYDGVIAIAASNADNKPWSGSSAGSKIAITAPGESVWVASRRFKEQTPHDCVVTATGTSYAVATTAGIAALWVSFHADNPTFQSLTNRGAAFAEVLKRGFRQVNGWDTSKYGPGIVDAKKVLEEPIPQISSGPAAPVCEDAEAAASLFEKNGSARIAQLLGYPGNEMCGLIQHLGDELAFHYAVNPSGQSAFERYNAVSSPNLGHMNNLRAALLAHELSPTLSSALRKVMP